MQKARLKTWGNHGLLAVPLAVIAFSIYARFASLGFESLWRDEFAQLRCYPMALLDMVQCAASHYQGPLDYTIGWLLYRAGLTGTDAMVRLPAVLFGLASIGMQYIWTRRFLGRFASAGAAALTAANALHFMMSQEARPYTIFLFFVLLTGWLYTRARERGGHLWLAFAAVIVSLLATRGLDAPILVALLGAHATLMWTVARFSGDPVRLRRENRLLARQGLAYLAAAGLYVPISVLALRYGISHGDIHTGIHTSPLDIIYKAGHLWRGFLGKAYGQTSLTFWILVACGGALMLRRALRRREPDVQSFLVSTVGLPAVFSIVLFLVTDESKAQYLFVAVVAISVFASFAFETAMAYLLSSLHTRQSGSGLGLVVEPPRVGMAAMAGKVLLGLAVGYAAASGVTHGLVFAAHRKEWRFKEDYRSANAIANQHGDSSDALFIGVRYGLRKWVPPFHGTLRYLDVPAPGTNLRAFNEALLVSGLKPQGTIYAMLPKRHVQDVFAYERADLDAAPFEVFEVPHLFVFRWPGEPQTFRARLVGLLTFLSHLDRNAWPEIHFSLAILSLDVGDVAAARKHYEAAVIASRRVDAESQFASLSADFRSQLEALTYELATTRRNEKPYQ